MRKVQLAFVLMLFSLGLCSQTVSIGYLGNMGLIIGDADKSIIIDGLHESYKPDYVYPTQQMVDQLTNGLFQTYGKTLIHMATHKHRDHFSRKLSAQFLLNNPSSALVGSSQITDSLQLHSNVNTITYNTEVSQYIIDDVKISAFKIGHAGKTRHSSIQNSAFVIEINGIKILHVGDTDWDIAEETMRLHQLSSQGVDIAVLPYWMLYSQKNIDRIKELISPVKVIATHIPPNLNKTELFRQGTLTKYNTLYRLG